MASGSRSNWLGFSLSPPHCADDVGGHHHHHHVDHQQQHPAVVASSFYYGVGGHHGVATSAAGAGLSSMPLMFDGSLSVMRTDKEQHHGVVVSAASPKLEDFLGMAGPPAMALSLGNSSSGFYYGGGLLQCDVSSGGAIMAGGASHHLHPLTLCMMSSAGDGGEPYNINMAAMDAAGKKRGGGQKQQQYRKSIDTFGQTSSQYRGVTRHKWTGRYEAHFWDNSCKKEGQARKGCQVYLGGYDTEEKAARAYDLATLKYWGHTTATHINFPLEHYQEELEEMKSMNKQQYVAHIRRKSTGFSRGASIYRGVSRHHQLGRWQARIGRVSGNKDLYLGTFTTQEEAAEAYDVAAIRFRGRNTVTNFDITRYDVDKILDSRTLLPADLARRRRKGKEALAMLHLTKPAPSKVAISPLPLIHSSAGIVQTPPVPVPVPARPGSAGGASVAHLPMSAAYVE